MSNCTLVFDTGEGTGISTSKSGFLDENIKYHIGVKVISGGGFIVDSGTILRKFTTRCGIYF